MTLENFVDFFQQELGVKVYPIQFPLANATEDCVVIDIVGGKMGVVSEISIQFMSRSSHPKQGENLLTDAIVKLNKMTNRIHGNTEIILIKCDTTNPYFLGQDDMQKFLYSTRFKILIAENKGGI